MLCLFSFTSLLVYILQLLEFTPSTRDLIKLTRYLDMTQIFFVNIIISFQCFLSQQVAASIFSATAGSGLMLPDIKMVAIHPTQLGTQLLYLVKAAVTVLGQYFVLP